MRKKFLSLAVVTAILAMFAMSGVVSAQPTSDSGNQEITVQGDTTLSLSLVGDMGDVTIGPFTAGQADQVVSKAMTGGDYIQVTDYTGISDSGHNFNISFDSDAWDYVGTDTDNFTDAAICNGGGCGSDEIEFEIVAGAGAVKTYDTKAGATCTPVTAATSMDLNTVSVKDKSTGPGVEELGQTDNTCPAIYYYQPEKLRVTAGSNGLGKGILTISGTVTVYDGT